jgi:hydroxyethylthiazole kinase-like uncharacterized protein yjeF
MQNIVLNSLLPDNSAPGVIAVGEGMSSTSVYKMISAPDIKRLLKPRKPFSHKGTFGHALLIAGQEQTMGAALLSATGCLYTGAGLTTVCIPASGLSALNTALPEVMYLSRAALSEKEDLDKFNSIAIGPGLGQQESSKAILKQVFSMKLATVIDADAINILAKDPELFKQIPAGSILTPHVKEFDGLFGVHRSWFLRLQSARDAAKKYQIIILLKNEYTFIIDQKSNVFINPTGNAAMAQGGMGDVLTGIVASLIAQGYTGADAAVIASYIHGSSGDDLAGTRFCVTASQVAKHIPQVIKSFFNK